MAVPLACTTGWILWAYLRLRPPASVTSTHPPLVRYGSWAYSHLAYSDLLRLYRVHHLADHAFPYVHTVIEYPVLTGLFMWCAAWFPGVGGYFLASSIGLLGCAWGCIVFLHRISPRCARIGALSPLLLVYSLLNWDLLAIFFMLAGWDCFRRRRYGWSGVLLSLGVCTKFFPVMLLLFCVVAAWSDGDDRRAGRGAATMSLSAIATALVVNVPFVIVNFAGWADFLRFNAVRGGGVGLLYQLHLASGWPIGVVDAVSAALVLAAVVVLALWVRRGASPAVAAAASFAVLMLLNKVFSPQYMLWVFVYGLLADWPGWTLAAVTTAGLVDYADAFITLHLMASKADALRWYLQTVFPLNRALRSGAIGCGVVASVWEEWRRPAKRGPFGTAVTMTAPTRGPAPDRPAGRMC